MGSTNARRSPNEIFAEFRRNRSSRRSANQLSFQGLESQRSATRTTSREADHPVAKRRVQKPGGRLKQAPAPGLLSPLEQMKVLREHGHLLCPKDRQWVNRISQTVKDRHSSAYLSERQEAVIRDIFDRFRFRLGD